jgi:hypothetical protein
MQERGFTEAWAEAEASAPPGAVGDEKDTIELRHAALAEPMRLVAATEDAQFWIEAGAPNGAGQLKLFTGVPFGFERPAMGPDSMPEMPFWLDNCVRELEPYLDDIAASPDPVRVRFRSYLMSDPAEVAWGPWEFVLGAIVVKGNRVSSVARNGPWHRLIWPRKVYDRETFPTLIPT